MRIQVPYDLPNEEDFYYVLLSVWDNNGWYDQIGFAAVDGHWGLTWAAGFVDCVTAVSYDPDAYALSLGRTYTFKMDTDSGLVTYSVAWGGALVWDLTYWTGGTAFVLSEWYACGGENLANLTNYEEVHDLVDEFVYGAFPTYGFFFSDNRADGASLTDWRVFKQNMTYLQSLNFEVEIEGPDVAIENEWFMLTLDSTYLATTGSTSLGGGSDEIVPEL